MRRHSVKTRPYDREDRLALPGGNGVGWQAPLRVTNAVRVRTDGQEDDMRASRRQFLSGLAAGTALAAIGARAGASEWRFGTTPVFLDDHVALLNDWGAYLSGRMETPIRFVQRRSYRDITELLLGNKVDCAWVCGAPYVQHKDRWRLLAVPLFQGEPLYRSYVIARRSSKFERIADLKGRTFAFSDPDSNSGHHVPRYRVRQLGSDPATFFGRSFFTYGHPRVIEAVAAGLAEAGAVDGYVWETLALRSPSLVEKTKVIDRSAQYGFPPIVAPATASPSQVERFRSILLGMGEDPGARSLLERLNLTGFAREKEALFGGIAAVLKELNALA
jgi:phosphonate transport system substrate-binding protein